MASLELLAPEILLAILTRLDNLDTLYNLLIASPRSWRLFDQHALIITESAMSGPDCDWLLPAQVSELIRAVALIRSSRDSDCVLPFEDLDTLHQKFLSQYMPAPAMGARREVGSFMSLGPFVKSSQDHRQINDPPSPAVFRSIVFTARHISMLARDCLLFYLGRLPDVRPRQCHNPELRYTHGYGPNDDWVKPWDRVFVGEPVEVRNGSDLPSWVEKMRIMRALWLLQLVGDLKAVFAHTDASSLPKWPVEDIDRLHSTKPESLAARPTWLGFSFGGPEEVRSVLDYLSETAARIQSRNSGSAELRYFRLPHPTNTRARWDGTVAPPEPCEMIWAGVGCRYDYGNRTEKYVPSPEVRKRHKSPRQSQERLRGQTRSALTEESAGTAMFKSFSTSEESPIRGVCFESFRRLGFAIWDNARVHNLGLMSLNFGANVATSFYMFAWESILPTEEVTKVKSRLRTTITP